MPTVHANGIDIWYEFRGEGPLVVLNHGWQGPSDEWKPEAIEGLQEHLRLLLYDVRGHGKTDAPNDIEAYSMPTYARDLAGLLDALEIEKAHILGSSQGGMIAAQFAVDFPQWTRSLLLCDSSAGNGLDEGSGGAWERTMDDAFELMERVAREKGLAVLAERRIQADRERDAHYFEYPEDLGAREQLARDRQTRMSLEAFVGTNRAIRLRPDLGGRIAKLRMPTLVLVGDWDDFRPCAERDHQLIEGSRFVLVRGAGHGVPSWRPTTFAQAACEFIADVEAGRDVAGEFEL